MATLQILTAAAMMFLSPCLGTERVCHQGQFLFTDLNGQQSCTPCPVGTFQSQLNHQNIDCAQCSKAEIFNYEKLLKQCTSTSDAEIGCIDGHYRDTTGQGLFRSGKCLACTECAVLDLYEIQACGPDKDTVCCPKPDMLISEKEPGIFECLDNLQNTATN